jgi:hypothetical protein
MSSIQPRSSCRRALRRVVFASLAAGLALAVPAVTSADRAKTAPAVPAPDRSERKDQPDHERRSDRDKGDARDKGDSRDKSGRGGDRGERSGTRREFKFTDEQWAETVAFMEANSPRMWDVYKQLPEKFRQGAMENIARRFDSLKQLQKRDPELYAIELKRVKVEDEIFGAVGEIRRARHAEEPERDQLEQRLREKVEELWAVRMEDRALQLPRIERQLEGLKMDDTVKALREERDADAGNKDKWVNGYIEFLKRMHGRRGRPPEPADRGGEDRRAEDRRGDDRGDPDRKRQDCND